MDLIHTPILGFYQFMHSFETRNCIKRKRLFEDPALEEAEEEQSPGLSPLLSWNDQPRDDDNDRKESKRRDFSTGKIKGEEDNGMVGWPPITLWRKKEFHGRPMIADYRRGAASTVVVNGNENGGRNTLVCEGKDGEYGCSKKTGLRLFH